MAEARLPTASSCKSVTKRFGDLLAVDDLSLELAGRRVLHPARAERLRQDDDAADGRRLRAAGRGGDQDRGRRRRRAAAAQAPDQHRLPELRPLPPPQRRGQRRLRPEAQEGAEGGDRPPGQRRAGAGRPRRRGEAGARRSSPAASSSGSRWRGRWSTCPRCCCSTSRSAHST